MSIEIQKTTASNYENIVTREDLCRIICPEIIEISPEIQKNVNPQLNPVLAKVLAIQEQTKNDIMYKKYMSALSHLKTGEKILIEKVDHGYLLYKEATVSQKKAR